MTEDESLLNAAMEKAFDTAVKAGRAMAQAEIEQLRMALKDAYDCFTTYSEHMPEYMHGESLKTHIKRYRAALQYGEGE